MSVAATERPLRELVSDVRRRGTILRPDDVGGPVAWQVLVRDGAVRVLRGDAGCLPGAAVGSVLRARLVAAEVPTGAVVTGRTSAWIHTGAGGSDHLELTYPAGRHQPDRPPGARLWQSPLLAPDTVHIGAVPVTTLERTVIELALHDDDPASLLLDLARRGADLGRARRRLEMRPRAVGRPRARRRLDAALATWQTVPVAPVPARARARDQA